MTSTTDLMSSPSSSSGAPEPTRRRPPVTAWLAAATVGVAVVFFVTVASLWLDRPGLYMDESNFVDAALGGHFDHQLYVYQRVGGLPVLIIPYIGTLKAAIYAPIFALWGVSVSTIRIPVIVISVGTLVMAYFMGREVIGRWSAILVLLMGTCPTFIFMTKVDWGPIVIAFFLTTALLLAFLRYVDTGRIVWLAVFFGVVLLGVFDKQNFLWIFIAVGVGAMAVYRRRLWQLARTRLKPTLVCVAAFGYCFLLELAFVLPNLSSSNGSSSLQDPLPHLAFAWGLFERTMGYSEVIGLFTSRVVSQPAWMDVQWVFSLAALGLLALRRRRGSLPDQAAIPAKAAVFFAIVFAVMLVEVAATKQATGPHHVIELLPYPTLVLLCSVLAVVRSGPVFRTASVVIAVAGLTLVLVAQVFSTTQYLSLMENPNRLQTLFSTAVYRDASFLNANVGSVDEVISAGWGPGTPLFSLACPRDRPKYRDDLWSRLVKANFSNVRTDVETIFGNRPVFLVSVHDVQRVGLPSNLYSNTRLLKAAYALVYPGRHPTQVLSTSAYDITYFGPAAFHLGSGDCG
jgi:MYXO-CTERM domain-containing protein